LGEFGDKFRKARESKELSLDDVSNVTKISARMLQAIEEERFDQLPGGVFNKGFIRAYAKHLGLNSEDAVTDYLACLRQAQIDAHEVWKPEAPPPPPIRAAAPAPAKAISPSKPAVTPSPVQVEELPDLQLPRADHIRSKPKEYLDRPSEGMPWRLIAVAAVILIAAIFLWARHSRNAHTVAARTAAAPPVTAPVVAQAPSPQNALPPTPAATAAHASTPVAAPAPTAKPAAALGQAHQPATPANSVEEKVVEKSDVTIRSFRQPPAQPSTKPAASLSLVIRATETSWISVTSDGQLVTQETLIAPANTTVRATREIVVRVGNAAGVAFLWNGEELPPQGAESEVKTFVFDHDGMRALSSQAPQ